MLCLKLAFFTYRGPILVLSGTDLPWIILLSWDIIHLSSLPELSLRKHQELLEHRYDFEQSHRFFSEGGAWFRDSYNVNFNGYWPFSLLESDFMAHSPIEGLRACPWLSAVRCHRATFTSKSENRGKGEKQFLCRFNYDCAEILFHYVCRSPVSFLDFTAYAYSPRIPCEHLRICQRAQLSVFLCLPFATKLFYIFVSSLVVNYSVIPLII